MPKTYTNIGTFTAGQTLTAASMNEIGDTLDNHTVPPLVKATQSSGQSINSGSYTVLTFDAETLDTDDMHSTTTNNSRVTFQTTGIYLVIAQVSFTSSIGTGQAVLRIPISGGSTYVAITEMTPTAGGTGMNCAGYFDCTAAGTDYVQAEVLQQAGAARTTNTGFTWLSAAFVGKKA